MKISAIVKLKDNAIHLRRVIDALQGFDEIIVVDLGVNTTDLEYARAKGAMIYRMDDLGIDNPNIARDTALHLVKSPWALLVNEDELVTPHLRDYLYEFAENPGDIKGLYIPRRNYVFDRWQRSSYPDYQKRMVHVESTKIPDVEGALAVIHGKTQKIPATEIRKALIRLTPSVEGMVATLNNDTTIAAAEKEHETVSLTRIILSPWWKFFRSYFMEGKFRYGIAGYISARNEAFASYIRLAKIYEYEIGRRETPLHDIKGK